ncbi:MAG: TetR/AcrR family transcriptional regulator, partial [Deltaproteobacteria bacterium]|nr:TetR/AcrR family transcriptional regulator [Deltaproteobacteria bacterium]
QEILDAAERVFTNFQPDRVGLKEVAAEAGVSHALITHYFGTYSGLIEAALERRLRNLRARLLLLLRHEGAITRPAELLGMLFRALEDPVHLRLMRWMLASERPSAVHALGLQDQGLKEVSRQIALEVTPTPSPELTNSLELAILTAVSAAYGYAMGKHALVGALGRKISVALDEAVQQTLAAMLQAYLQTQLDDQAVN